VSSQIDEFEVRRALENGAYEEAVSLLRPLAEHDSNSALLLGYIHETGVIGAPNRRVACSYYERAATLGSGQGYFELGRLLSQDGEEAKARLAYEGGAHLGHLQSMARLGTIMIDGSGGPIDVEGGMTWLETAAGNGDVLAGRKLLAIEARNAKTISDKMVIALRIIGRLVMGGPATVESGASDKAR